MNKSDIKVAHKWRDGYDHKTDQELSSQDLDDNFVVLADAIVNLEEGETTTTSIDDTDSPYTALGTDTVILADDTSGAITINLPAAASNSGKVYTVVKLSASNAVTIDGNSTETINGSLTQVLSRQYDTMKIVCDGSNWLVENKVNQLNITDITDSDSPYTVLVTDDVIRGDDTSGAITVNLPAVASSLGRKLRFKKLSASNSITVDGNASETIDGATTQALSSQYDSLTIICNGTSWDIV